MYVNAERLHRVLMHAQWRLRQCPTGDVWECPVCEERCPDHAGDCELFLILKAAENVASAASAHHVEASDNLELVVTLTTTEYMP